MIVRDQPAPRGQLIHRDGTRVFLCSIADLVTYERAPSPHGAPAATYVEVMAADADPADTSTAARPWRSVDRAEFVVGGLHRPVMGEPVLVFDDLATARAAAERLGSRAVDWEELKEALDEDGRVPGNE
ncbi:MAG: nitrous oxide reductase accessory protein NosL [Myxococcales bacterium]|nr:nitrous oxide reductase accessory protein NosL [Myxococcales bacterium]